MKYIYKLHRLCFIFVYKLEERLQLINNNKEL